MRHTELSCRSIILSIVLTLILAMSNAYLALKLGILTSASIPAAIISMGILRLFKQSTVLENNAVQTAASAGEAVAGGIVYTIPALIIIGYWHGFDYWTNFFIAASGGVLGVLFSIPLRRILVNDNALKFPEGRAIAEVLKSSRHTLGIHDIAWGGLFGALLSLLQNGFKLIAASVTYWFSTGRTFFGIGIGFSPTMIGAGCLVGFEMALSIFLGALISWGLALPLVSHHFPEYFNQPSTQDGALMLWNNQMCYLGIGGMLFAGIWTFAKLIKPLAKNVGHSWRMLGNHSMKKERESIDKDLPWSFILTGVAFMTVCLFIFFARLFPTQEMGLGEYSSAIVLGSVLYVLIVGFLFSVMTAYFSGMVGVTASPGSSVVIAGILAASALLYRLMLHVLPIPFSHEVLQMAEAIVIVIGSVVTGIAAIANDNTQDLKVGQLVGATPWKQQAMLLLGVMISSFIIPPVMQLLFEVYGIAGVMPHAGMDINQSLPAPTAALLAAITEGVFHNHVPWLMMLCGALIIFVILGCNYVFKLERWIRLSILGIAIGMYLPMSSSFPLFIGGVFAVLIKRCLQKAKYSKEKQQERTQVGTLIACGLVAGSAIMDVCLAIPFSIMHSPDALSLVDEHWQTPGLILGIIATVFLAYWMMQRVLKTVKNN